MKKLRGIPRCPICGKRGRCEDDGDDGGLNARLRWQNRFRDDSEEATTKRLRVLDRHLRESCSPDFPCTDPPGHCIICGGNHNSMYHMRGRWKEKSHDGSRQ